MHDDSPQTVGANLPQGFLTPLVVYFCIAPRYLSGSWHCYPPFLWLSRGLSTSVYKTKAREMVMSAVGKGSPFKAGIDKSRR